VLTIDLASFFTFGLLIVCVRRHNAAMRVSIRTMVKIFHGSKRKQQQDESVFHERDKSM
jgi:hydrogenase/urease accessory protein HupE